MSVDYGKMQEVFLAAVEHHEPEQWDAYLDEACAGDEELRRQVAMLLKAHAQEGSLPGRAALGMDRTGAYQPRSECPGTVIGPYKLVEQIGEGGMGTVWMAQQTEPVKRLVALKVIKPGMDSRQVLVRFEAERQALALMDHPNIAKVLDAGATATSRPYFVMELVKGVPLTRYCDEHRLTPRQRLELFIPLCQAIQHAHQKGIIHRDIKPSNVLVALYDGKPVPKVIDFGIAKATGQQLTEHTLITGLCAAVGTLEYMSPEQAELNQLDIDTRSDIYSLGVLLYELLTGTTPLDRKRLKEAAMLEVLRIIREEEPPRPSTRLSTTEELPSVAANRGLEPKKLSSLVRGELDWIVMKALEKDRNRRYETANGLALDVQRYLADEPVLACPPSAWYRLRKFAKKNQKLLATTVGFAALLIAGVIVSTYFAVEAELSRQDADQNARQARQNEAKAVANETRARQNETRATTNETLAKQNETRAKENEKRANENAKMAHEQKSIAQAQEKLAKRRYYAAQMNLAMQAWESKEPARVLELLETQRPKFDEEDLRGFEWYYLWRVIHPGLRRTFMEHKHLPVSPPWDVSVAFCPGTEIFATGSWARGGVKVVDAASGRRLALLGGEHVLHPWCEAFSPDGKTLAVGDNRGIVWLFEVGSWRKKGELRLPYGIDIPHGIRTLAFAPDSKTLAAGHAVPGEGGKKIGVTLWNVATGKEWPPLQNGDKTHFCHSLAFSLDGKRLATAQPWRDDSSPIAGVWLWDLTTQPPRVVRDWKRSASSVAFSPDGKLLAAAVEAPLDTGEVRVLDVATGEERYRNRDLKCGTLAWSSDGKTLGAGSDRTVNLWELATGTLASLPHHSAVSGLAFSSGGKLLASAEGDGPVRVWDISVEPEPYASIPNFRSPPFRGGLAFSPDGKTLGAVIVDLAVSTRLW